MDARRGGVPDAARRLERREETRLSYVVRRLELRRELVRRPPQVAVGAAPPNGFGRVAARRRGIAIVRRGGGLQRDRRRRRDFDLRSEPPRNLRRRLDLGAALPILRQDPLLNSIVPGTLS